ncbi:MAG: glutamate racemase [Acidobacteria bacterium 37-65-4]|nr:MAG: glutamate racemase [Acidobacteria bacterium 37-65-4]
MSAGRPIGVFDSGVGGLTVVAELRRRMPWQDILYFGDTARVPYGNKSPQTVLRYSLEIGRFLVDQGISHLVVACNTSSAVALETLDREMPVPVLGMIEPGARAAAAGTRNGRVGLVDTRGTVASDAYPRAVRKIRPDIQVYSQACPLFVPLVEEGWTDGPVALEVAHRYLDTLLAQGVDTLILGCTHYPVLIPVLRQVTGPGVALLSSAQAAVHALQEMLPTEDGQRGRSRMGRFRCFVTDAGTHFTEIGERILGEPIGTLTAIEEERLVAP